MTNTVLIKRSGTANAVPVAGNLVAGELAINFTDGNLFYKNAGNVVTVIASNQFSSVTGNVTGGNILTGGTISAVGNITGNYFIGNGSQLTGVVTAAGSSIVNGTSNVVVAANGNVTVGVAGTATVATFTTTGLSTNTVIATGNVTGNYFIGNGSQLTGLPSGSSGNLLVVGRIATYFVPIFFGILNIIGRTGNIEVTISP
jgi:hypothetical protein